MTWSVESRHHRHSGVPWLGPIPSHWGTAPLKYHLGLVNGLAFKPSEWSDTGVPIIRIENLNGSLEFNYATTTAPSTYHVVEGDLLFAWSGNRGTSFGPFTWLLQGLHYLNQHIFRVENTRFDQRWLYWTLKALTAYVESQAHGIIGLVHITRDDLGAIAIPLLPVEEQRQIRVFLDRETAEIDALTDKKERLITLLEEKRAALINRAATKGLDPTAQMKDSGIPWLGRVPANWTLAPIGSRYSVQLGKMLDSNRITGEHLAPYLRNVDVQWDRINAEDLPEMDFRPDDQDRYRLRWGDLLVCEGGEAGRCAAWDSPIPECFYQKALHRLRPLTPSEHPRFLYYCLRAAAGAGLFTAEGNPNTIDHLTAEKLRKHRFPFPTGAEQAEIAAALDRETARIDAIIAKTRGQIAKFHEYRTALISAAVTGKIDVRDRRAPSAEFDKHSRIDEH